MGKKVESFQADDGRLFATEREIGLGAISHNADRLLEILQPLASCPPKNHPAKAAQTTLEPPVAEDRPVRLAHG